MEKTTRPQTERKKKTEKEMLEQEIELFEAHLRKLNLAANTVLAYTLGARLYLERYKELDKERLLAYKGELVGRFKPQTVNLRIQGLNRYLDFRGHGDLKLSFVKVQQRMFLENVVSDADYRFLKRKLKQDGRIGWYFVVWFLTATGARISELLQLKVEHVIAGHMDLYSKGGKLRRLYIPRKLRTEALTWLNHAGRTSGYLFLNKYGERITARSLSWLLKHYATGYGLNPHVIYPHSFRHRYAKNFLERHNDISLLADLMGHEKLETTRIYLRQTATEQRGLVDKVVDW